MATTRTPPRHPAVGAAEPAAFSALDTLRVLRAAGDALLEQAGLHGHLAWVEWEEEKNRLLKMLLVTLLGFACLLCAMLFGGGLLLILCWETVYRIPAAMTLIVVYGLGAQLAWRRFVALSALSARSFAASRAELATDIALLRSRL